MKEDTPSARPVTIRDLAARLKIAHSTVSRALSPPSGRSRMRPETRERIVQLAREMGYQPNAMALHLVSRRTHSVGVIVRHLNDPFSADLLQEIHLNLARLGYLGMFLPARDPAEFEYALGMAAGRRVDGLISVMLRPGEKRHVRQFAAPVVYYGDSDKRVFSVGVAPLRGVAQAMAHLQSLGHREIGFIGQTDLRNHRYRAYRDFIRAHRLPFEPDWVGPVDGGSLEVSVNGVYEVGRSRMARLLEQARRPTAVICHNDVMAVGAMRALAAAKVAMPREMALVGYDNLREGEFACVSLTTVDPHLDRIARLLVETLVGRIEGRLPEGKPVKEWIEPTLVIRESTAGAGRGA